MFIEFMLSAIKASLIDAINASDEMRDGKMDKATTRWKQNEKFLKSHEFIMYADVRMLCGVSVATAKRILAGFASEGKLISKESLDIFFDNSTVIEKILSSTQPKTESEKFVKEIYMSLDGKADFFGDKAVRSTEEIKPML